jgi:hypothetical protein
MLSPMLDRPKLPEEVRQFFAATGSQGGKQRAKNLTAKQRKQIARKAARERWKRTGEDKTHGRQNS